MLSVAEQTSDIRPTQQAFLNALLECGSITEAAQRIGIDRSSHYDWLESERARGLDTSEESPTPTSYAHAFLRAKRIAADRIRERSEQQALSDEDSMPNTIARIFHIKRWFPEYRDQLNVKHSGTVWHANVDLNALSDTDRAQLLSLAAERATLRLNPAPSTDTSDTPPAQ